MKTRIPALLLVLILSLSLPAACGRSAEEAAPDAGFLMGSWIAETATVDDLTMDAGDAFGGVFTLYFSENGDCTMSIDDQRATVRWELTDDGVLLTGNDTYPITFPDESRTTMIAVIKGLDVLLRKYEAE